MRPERLTVAATAAPVAGPALAQPAAAGSSFASAQPGQQIQALRTRDGDPRQSHPRPDPHRRTVAAVK